jgi:hypothetical protein
MLFRSISLAATLLTLPFAASRGIGAEGPDFNREVRPILSRYCFKCHGPDDKARKSKLRLDVREDAMKEAKSGSIAIIPGKPDESELCLRIFSTDKEEVMPPTETKHELTAEQKDVLKRWIAAGADYQPHWAFTPPKQGAPPSVGEVAGGNVIDAFIRARLQKEGLALSTEADRATLIRRVSFDLTGLPPKPEDVAAFEADSAPDAYERLVDRLLASPQYGERWARRWLDLARYADTNGYEKDRNRSIWPYRDWVVRALNADMPFDQFTIEQIAGDLLPNSTTEQKIATGFHRNTMLNEEGGIDPLEFRFHAMTDRVATTGVTWLGLTIGCAQCHTHKFDPILHREYYQFMAFMNNADEPELDLTPPNVDDQRREREAKAAKLLAELPSKWPLPADATVAEPAKEKDAAAPDPAKRRAELVEQAFGKWLETERARTVRWTALRPVEAKSNSPLLTVQPDSSVLASGDITKSDTYELKLPAVPGAVTAFRLEALPDDSLPAHGPGLAYYEGPKGDFFLGEFQVFADGKQLTFARATESYSRNAMGGTPVSAKLATDGDPQTGWNCAGRMGEAHEAIFVLGEPVQAQKLEVKMMFGRHYACSLGRFRISATTDTRGADARGLGEEVEELLLISDGELTAAQRAKLRESFLLNAPELAEHAKKVREARKPPAYETTLVMRERPAQNPRPTFIHNRGEYIQPTDRVEPDVPAFLNQLPPGSAHDRLAFARWLVSRDNPLTARVVVNRAWAAFFGRGIVKTTEDFGYQGDLPSHPELLDWLAVDFMNQGWSMKKLHRLIVTSATYRQSSKVAPAMLAKDAENRLLSRFPRIRLEAEMVRDGTLQAAGLLSLKLGGPPVRPPQADGVSDVAYGNPKWEASAGVDRYRRSLYTYVKRTAPFALYNTFDAPTGESCIARRDVSNTPLQALTLLNDVTFVEAAQALGKLLATHNGADEDRLDLAYERILCRRPRAGELPRLREFVQTQRERFSKGELDPKAFAGKDADAERAAWTALARALFNLDEVVTKS